MKLRRGWHKFILIFRQTRYESSNSGTVLITELCNSLEIGRYYVTQLMYHFTCNLHLAPPLFKCMAVAAVRWRAFPHQCMVQRHTLSKHRQTLLCTLRPQQTYTATFFYIYVCVFVLLLCLFIPRVSRQSKLQIQFDYLERSSNVYSIVSRFYNKIQNTWVWIQPRPVLAF